MNSIQAMSGHPLACMLHQKLSHAHINLFKMTNLPASDVKAHVRVQYPLLTTVVRSCD